MSDDRDTAWNPGTARVGCQRWPSSSLWRWACRRTTQGRCAQDCQEATRRGCRQARSHWRRSSSGRCERARTPSSGSRIAPGRVASVPRLPTISPRSARFASTATRTSSNTSSPTATYGLDDFDDTAQGPSVIDLVRFLGSLRLAARERGWSGQFDRLADAFLRGYQRSLNEPSANGPTPRIVGRLRQRPVRDQAAFLAWAEGLMTPVPPPIERATRQAFDLLAATATGEPHKPAGYFKIKRMGAVNLGIGSRRLPKLLLRVEGPTAAVDDDVILEAKAPANLTGVECLAPAEQSAAVRVVTGTEQIGRLRHEVLSLVPKPDARQIPLDTTGGFTTGRPRTSKLTSRRSARPRVVGAGRGCRDAAWERKPSCRWRRDADRRRRESRAIAALDARLRQHSIRLTNDLLRAWEAFRRQPVADAR